MSSTKLQAANETNNGHEGKSDPSKSSSQTTALKSHAKRPTLTHFLCIPLVHDTSRPQLEHALQQFKQDIAGLRDHEASNDIQERQEATNPRASIQKPVRRIPDSAVRPIGSIHLTLGVMSLLSPKRLQEARDLLKHIQNFRPSDHALNSAATLPKVPSKETVPTTASSPSASSELKQPQDAPDTSQVSQSIQVNITSLKSMTSPTKARVLYAVPVDPSEKLYSICCSIRDTFMDADLIVQDDRPLKLHATIVNTNHVKGRGRNKRPLEIDASAFIERYKEFVWAKEVDISRIAICEMGAKDVVDKSFRIVDQVYKEVASVPFPV